MYSPLHCILGLIQAHSTDVAEYLDLNSARFNLAANGCNAPNAPHNGVVKPIKDSFRVNEKVWFACRQGYILRGRKDLVCQGNERWSDDEPTCDRE